MSTANTSIAGSNNSGNSTKPKVYIYIDNSNIYIQGAKTYLSGSNPNPVADPSWRYNISSLRQVLIQNSDLQFESTATKLVHTTVYGSVPPPDDFWKAMASQDVTVHTYDRSPITGKEKQVDMKMGVDITRQATRDQITGSQSEFIIVTGDADLYPAVEAINESGFRAHVWSWANSFSSAYQAKSDIKLYHLDSFKNNIGYQRANSSTKPCKWGKYCRENLNCQYSHSINDDEYFKQTGGPKQMLKHWLCYNGENCNRKNTCIYYHNESERICLTCDQAGQGHGAVGSAEWQSVHGSS